MCHFCLEKKKIVCLLPVIKYLIPQFKVHLLIYTSLHVQHPSGQIHILLPDADKLIFTSTSYAMSNKVLSLWFRGLVICSIYEVWSGKILGPSQFLIDSVLGFLCFALSLKRTYVCVCVLNIVIYKIMLLVLFYLGLSLLFLANDHKFIYLCSFVFLYTDSKFWPPCNHVSMDVLIT